MYGTPLKRFKMKSHENSAGPPAGLESCQAPLLDDVGSVFTFQFEGEPISGEQNEALMVSKLPPQSTRAS